MTSDQPPPATRRRVRAVYDEIAAHFAETRHHPWPETEQFVADLGGDGAPARPWLGLDLGCGNGRHTAVLADGVDRVLGLDLSRGLLGEARSRVDPEGVWVQGDAATLPVATDVVDVAVYVATLHHLPDRGTRRRSLSELARVLAPGGRALVSTWATAHDRFDANADDETGFDTTVGWTLPGGETVPRFYHIYAPAEFDRDIAASGATVARTWVSSGNCYAELVGERTEE